MSCAEGHKFQEDFLMSSPVNFISPELFTIKLSQSARVLYRLCVHENSGGEYGSKHWKEKRTSSVLRGTRNGKWIEMLPGTRSQLLSR